MCSPARGNDQRRLYSLEFRHKTGHLIGRNFTRGRDETGQSSANGMKVRIHGSAISRSVP
jgi:hypothetical protein